FLLSDLRASDTASLLTECQGHLGDLYIKDIEFREVQVQKTNYDDHIKVISNDTEDANTIALEGNWKTLEGSTVNQIHLESFASAVLIKTDDPTDPTDPEEPTDPDPEEPG